MAIAIRLPIGSPSGSLGDRPLICKAGAKSDQTFGRSVLYATVAGRSVLRTIVAGSSSAMLSLLASRRAVPELYFDKQKGSRANRGTHRRSAVIQ